MKRVAILLVTAVTATLGALTRPPQLPSPMHHFYIGSFGPRDNPVAAFKCGDEIVNARAGEMVDGCMVECIEPAYVDLVTPEGRQLRVALVGQGPALADERCGQPPQLSDRSETMHPNASNERSRRREKFETWRPRPASQER